MPGVSFDQAVEFYDATRAYPPGVAERLRDAIAARAGERPGAPVVEIGIGTGRVALPFIQAGYAVTGVDLSVEMMLRLRSKLAGLPGAPAVRLVQGDAMRLPLRPASFAIVLMAHVLHLVDDWRAALREAVALVRPGGALVLIDGGGGVSREPGAREAGPNQSVGAQWSGIQAELGYQPQRERHVRALDDAVIDELRALGMAAERALLVEYEEEPRTAREIAGRFAGRIYSRDWATPEDIHAEASRRLWRWLEESCPNPDEPLAGVGQIRALIARRRAA